MKRCFFVLTVLAVLSGCVNKQPLTLISPRRVMVKKELVQLPPTRINATYGLMNDPEVIKAYKIYSQTGQAKTIRTHGFKTVPYEAHAQAMITCEPLHLCVVQLESDEIINNIELGDGAHWLVNTAFIGDKEHKSYQVTVKPKAYQLATDMIITTTKRTYNIGLVSQKGASTHLVNFYYPEETLKAAIKIAHSDPLRESQVIDNRSHIDVENINFNYRIRGNHVPWLPKRVFDDGKKTFIEMPKIAAHMSLPVLYIKKAKHMALVNYRYQAPFYVIDGLFGRAYLISGKGRNQVKVIINKG